MQNLRPGSFGRFGVTLTLAILLGVALLATLVATPATAADDDRAKGAAIGAGVGLLAGGGTGAAKGALVGAGAGAMTTKGEREKARARE